MIKRILNYFRKEDKIYTVKLHEDGLEALNSISAMFLSFLKNDKNWHFFWEGDYYFLRFSERSLRDVEDYIEEKGIVFSHLFEWRDNHSIVEKYKKYFTRIFHENSVLAVLIIRDYGVTIEFEDYKKDLESLADRVLHSMYNMQHYYIEQKGMDSEIIEMKSTAEIAINRAHYAGYRKGAIMANDYHMRKNEKETDTND